MCYRRRSETRINIITMYTDLESYRFISTHVWKMRTYIIYKKYKYPKTTFSTLITFQLRFNIVEQMAYIVDILPSISNGAEENLRPMVY